jgi:hypothetical protein
MSNYWNNQVALPAPELIATMTGSNVVIGSLLFTPVKLIMDNQGTVPIILYTSYDGGATLLRWHTFPGGEALILDDDLFPFPKGLTFVGNGASGNFSISYTYAKQSG